MRPRHQILKAFVIVGVILLALYWLFIGAVFLFLMIFPPFKT